MMRKTCYDINPEPEKKWFKIASTVKCSECKKMVNGYLVLDRGTLQVVDSSGFLIIDEPICDYCNIFFRLGFKELLKETAEEMGTSLKKLGIDGEGDDDDDDEGKKVTKTL